MKKKKQESLGPKKYLPESKRRASIWGQAKARGREGHAEEKRKKDLKRAYHCSQRRQTSS